MKISTLIVDDEKASREGLELLCSDYPELKIIGVCKDGIEAIDSIRSFRPQLVLLDIQMPRVDGFEVLASLPPPLPQIIFITAHDQYAIKAFEINAVDYILKPFSDDRFKQAIQRAANRIAVKEKQNLDAILKSKKAPNSQPDLRASDDERLVLKSNGSIHMLNKSDIVRVEAFDYYVKIHLLDQFFLIRETMKNMEAQLIGDQFLRTHKSHIINKAFIQSLTKSHGTDYEIKTTNEHTVKVSRSKVNEVKEWIG